MKTISEIPLNILLGLFYLAIGYSILANQNSQIGAYLFNTFGLPNQVVSNLLALALGTAGVYMWFGDVSGNRFKLAGFPMMAYMGISSAAVLASRSALGGSEMISVFAMCLLYLVYDADAKRQSLQEFAQKKANEVLLLQAEMDKIKQD